MPFSLQSTQDLLKETSMTEITQGIFPSISNDHYHSSKEWLSSSQVKVALASAFHFKFYVKDGKGQKKSTESKDFGSLTHKLILEPNDFSNEYAVFNDTNLDLRKTADKQLKEDFAQANKGKIIVSQDLYQKAVQCKESVYSHKDARRYLEMQGQAEVSCYINSIHELPGGEKVPFKMRTRPDMLVPGKCIIDLKTSKSPAKDSFEKDAFAPWGYNYDLSAYYELTGDVLPFVWIVVKNDEPWETAVYTCSEKRYRSGEAKFKQAMNTIILSERHGKWLFQENEEEL
jgi:hypothetical protein